MSECPWEEVPGFYLPAHFDRIRAMVENAVRAGLARKVSIDDRVVEGRHKDQEWFEHIPSGEVWQLVPPTYEGRSETDGYFLRVRWTPYPRWEQRQRGYENAEPFWKTGAPLEHEKFINVVEQLGFFSWLGRQLASGRLREIPVPNAVVDRSLGRYPWRWMIDQQTGHVWQFNKSGIAPLELPPSLESLRPKLS